MKMKTIWKDQVELNVFYQEINVIDILKCKTCLLNIIKFFFSGRNNKYFQNTQVFSEVSDKKNLDFTASLDWTSLV